jgi:hypothetical protein
MAAGAPRPSALARPSRVTDKRGGTAFRPWLLAVLILLAACGQPAPSFDRLAIAEQDGPAGGSPCPATAIEGVLASSDRWLIGLAGLPGVAVRGVLWPPGYAAARTSSGLVLLDEESRVVGHVGDRVRSGGEDGADGVWLACRPVVLPSASPA